MSTTTAMLPPPADPFIQLNDLLFRLHDQNFILNRAEAPALGDDINAVLHRALSLKRLGRQLLLNWTDELVPRATGTARAANDVAGAADETLFLTEEEDERMDICVDMGERMSMISITALKGLIRLRTKSLRSAIDALMRAGPQDECGFADTLRVLDTAFDDALQRYLLCLSECLEAGDKMFDVAFDCVGGLAEYFPHTATDDEASLHEDDVPPGPPELRWMWRRTGAPTILMSEQEANEFVAYWNAQNATPTPIEDETDQSAEDDGDSDWVTMVGDAIDDIIVTSSQSTIVTEAPDPNYRCGECEPELPPFAPLIVELGGAVTKMKQVLKPMEDVWWACLPLPA